MPHRFRDEWLVSLARDVHGVPAEFIAAARTGSNPFLASALIRGGLVTAEALGPSVSHHYGCAFVRPTAADIDRALLEKLPERICRQHHVLPLGMDTSHVRVAMASPHDIQAEDEIRFATGRRPVVSYCTPDHLEDLINHILEPDQLIFDLLRKVDASQPVELLAATSDESEVENAVHAPVIRLVNAIIAKAVDLKASDIHIEHEERASQVRYRVDGVLRTGLVLPRYLAAGPMVSRLKIMAKLDVAERRRPQDGQAKVRVGDVAISMRISTLPTQFGEKVVARVLDARNARLSLADLGFRPSVADRLTPHLRADQGFILVTGPTGSGKTTTLYAAISSLADGETNIVSIEDPIEYQLAGVNQVQINERQGLTFPSVLRSVLRQDPDVILVGEIRDAETADVACQAAMTGHLVLSTLHTNDSTSALARLMDMGVDRYKVVSALRAVTAQRLLRRLCRCRRPSDPVALVASVRDALRRNNLPERAFSPGGCAACQFTGFTGRVVITEILDVTSGLAEAMTTTMTSASLRTEAARLGALESLEKDALWHMTEGHAAVDDVAAFVEQHDGERVAGGGSSGAKDQPMPPPPRTNPGVLVAHADERRSGGICAVLTSAGYRVDTAPDGPSAVARMAVQVPDALITDANLPLMSGIDLIRYVRGNAGLASLPIVAVHGDQERDLRQALAAAGATEVLADGVIEAVVVPLLGAALARTVDFSAASDVMTARLPADEDARLQALRRTGLLDSPREERFDTITQIAARTFNAPIALVTLVDKDRQWFKANEGLPATETPRDQAFCAHAILRDDVMVVSDAALDPRFSENPLVTGDPNIRFYAGCPITTPDGHRLGTLCVIDRVPRAFSEADKQTLVDLGKLVQREIAATAAPGSGTKG